MFASLHSAVALRRLVPPALLGSLLVAFARAQSPVAPAPLPAPQPVPRMQAVPQPGNQVSLQREGIEIARYHFDPDVIRPYVFPLIGPSGRSITRIGHPHDPVSHSHHYSVWIGHKDINGVNFWEERGPNVGRIVHQGVEEFEDSDDATAVQVVNAWTDKTGKILLTERRRTSARWLPDGEWLLVVDIQLNSKTEPVTLGKTSFGPIAVRMAKTIGVHDGSGTIRNSEGAVNEKGVFWQPARWVDYSGPIAPGVSEGATLLDHPTNPSHPAVFHVRDDGWMGASITFAEPRVLAPDQPLQLRYAVYVHAGQPSLDRLQQRWAEFAATAPAVFKEKKKP